MFVRFLTVALVFCMATSISAQESAIDLTLRSRTFDEGRLAVSLDEQAWEAKKTAVIVCDMWDAHHCLNAVRRVGELAPRMNQFLKVARDRGVTIIHAPSSCVGFYDDHPARKNVAKVPKSKNAPVDIETWCHWKDPSEEKN